MIAHRAKMKYMDWLAQWLENYVRPSVKARTYEHYKRIAEQHIRGKIGGLALGALTPLVLQRFVTELLQSGNRKTGKGLSANSAKAVISVVQSSLRTANLLGLTAEDDLLPPHHPAAAAAAARAERRAAEERLALRRVERRQGGIRALLSAQL